MGGVATVGIMSHWTGHQEGGVFAELREKARDCECPEVINPEKLKALMLNMLEDAGVTVQLYTWSVSYTHLDVYKRQGKSQPWGMAFKPDVQVSSAVDRMILFLRQPVEE